MYLEFLAKLCSSRFASPHKTSNKTDKEKMRLLYVSFTRAKNKLYVFLPINEEDKVPVLGT
ncbi:MAG: 3'-5' exonuclease, partial [Rhodospirillales bacterium]|nr:3'-5' exonuclease [Rhodospirillales bacterium]